jgi:hypothetical protein
VRADAAVEPGPGAAGDPDCGRAGSRADDRGVSALETDHAVARVRAEVAA